MDGEILTCKKRSKEVTKGQKGGWVKGENGGKVQSVKIDVII